MKVGVFKKPVFWLDLRIMTFVIGSVLGIMAGFAGGLLLRPGQEN